MSRLPPSRPKASAGYVWLRIALWLSPGIMVIGWLSLVIYPGFATPDELIYIGGLVVIGLVTICAGGLDCALHLTRTRGRGSVRPGLIVGWTIAFVLTQVLLVPTLLFATVLACGIIV